MPRDHRRKHTQFHGISWENPDGAGANRGRTWRVRFGRNLNIGVRFAVEEDAARWADVAKLFIQGPGATLNFDGSPPPGWTRTTILKYLVERGFICLSDLANILARYNISDDGEILAPLKSGRNS